MQTQHPEPSAFWRSPAGVGLLAATAIGGFFLLAEHTAHVFGVLPYVLVLLCPLMHAFMHRGHHHGGRPSRPRSTDDEQRRQ